jgi:hypothetical protein
MSGWQKIGAVVSVLWMIGLPIYLIVLSGSFKTVGHALVAGNILVRLRIGFNRYFQQVRPQQFGERPRQASRCLQLH